MLEGGRRNEGGREDDIQCVVASFPWQAHT